MYFIIYAIKLKGQAYLIKNVWNILYKKYLLILYI